jgi:K+-sensing histidine kinase KdpD
MSIRTVTIEEPQPPTAEDLRAVLHDLRNQLTVLSGGAEVLLMGTSAEDPARILLEQMRDACRRLNALSHRLADGCGRERTPHPDRGRVGKLARTL